MIKTEERLFNVKEVAERMGVSHYTILDWLRLGGLKGQKYGRSWRVREADLEAFIANPPDMRQLRAASQAPTVPAPPADPTPQQREAALVARVRALHAEGLSSQAIANRFNTDGVPTLSGRGQWQKGTVANLLAQAEDQSC
jgi:excisionase family DNA binding protein